MYDNSQIITKIWKFLETHQIKDYLVIYIEWGHFSPNLYDEFFFSSIQAVEELLKNIIQTFWIKTRIVLWVLVDDLGIDCSGNSCSINSSNTSYNTFDSLPDLVKNEFKKLKYFKENSFLVFSEKTSKNRWIDFLKKHYPVLNSDELYEKDNELLYDNKIDSFTFAKKSDNSFTAKCPLIMANHYRDVILKLNQRFTDKDHMIIDYSDLYDQNKVANWNTLFSYFIDRTQIFNNNIEVINVFMSGEEKHLYVK